MKATILLVSLLASSALGGITIKDFEKKFHKVFADPKVEEKAEEQLEKAEESIEANNEAFVKGESTFIEALNEMSDLTDEEIGAEKFGALPEYGMGALEMTEEHLRALQAENEPYLREIYARAERWGRPSSYDAVKEGLVTPVRSQEQCGSCAAFSATAVHETCYLKQGASKSIDLSEEQLLSCGYQAQISKGCEGGWTDKYINFFAQNMGGVGALESQIRYQGYNDNRYLKCNMNVKTNSGVRVTKAISDGYCSESKLESLVYQYGAVGVYIRPVVRSFMHYAGGVLKVSKDDETLKPGEQHSGHAITVVGYFNDDSGCYFWGWFCFGSQNSYWIIKNSWGTKWGEGGYAKIQKGANVMGMEQHCFVAECAKARLIQRSETTTLESPKADKPSCDLSKKYPDFYPMNGDWTLGKEVGNSTVEVEIQCKDSVCSPMAEDVTDACLYICGSSTC